MTATPLDDAVAAARRGALIVFPTDTVYGVGTRPDDPAATAAVFAAKDRPADLTLPVLVASAGEARRIAAFDARADVLADGCWPGPLTLVLPRTDAAAGFDLGGDPATIGVRVPDHPLALAVLARTGPLAVTSANRSGEPPATTCDQLVATFEDAVAVYLCEEPALEGRSSTVLDLAHGPARVLRAGDVSADRLARLLPGEGPLLDSPPS
ncbi:MAG TPA: L-threonylcarbamoyladenylate synthase [Actinomycetota bacterium]|nr:L-threonylcarbamoyladenylate synthase [Actinomycetota bacterium]